MKLFSPVRKVAFGITMITVSLLLMAELIGIVPSEHRGFLEGRRLLCESFALQFSIALGKRDLALVQATLDNLVKRDGGILSAAVVNHQGREVLHSGVHAKHWVNLPTNESTVNHVQVPIFEGRTRWGSIQVAFRDLPTTAVPYGFGIPLLPLSAFMTLGGFLAYLLFIKRTLKELDPSSVVPERVKSAFDALAEGLVIMDEKQNVILANTAFSEKVEREPGDLIGHQLSRINWHKTHKTLPWVTVLQENTRQSGSLVRFTTKKNGDRTFTVNATPIGDGKGGARGVLVTFDDMTDLERKQVELKQTVTALEHSRKALQDKAVELELLATRDPLTGCLNRRAFFDRADTLLAQARTLGTPLCCIMTDIDHFKAINDNHGHGVGDQVIKLVADELRNNARPDDIVGRYGGEEFVVMLPGVDVDAAVAIAERLRLAIKNGAHRSYGDTMRVTSSFGVSRYEAAIETPTELITLADRALYQAKESGRNRVVAWSGEAAHLPPQAGPAAEAAPADAATTAVLPEDDAALDIGLKTALPAVERAVLQSRIADLESRLESSEQARNDEMGHDAITGLPNRMLLMDRLRQTAARSQRFDRISAVIVLDIDLFRRINDALGFAIGDKVLRKTGERLLEILRQTDTVSLLIPDDYETVSVSRTGADEFVILVNDLQDASAATWIVKRMLEHVSVPLNIDSNEIFINCSAGISLFPYDTTDPEELLRNASTARYKAKHRQGREKFAFFSEDMNEVSTRSLWLEGQMRNALDNGEFALHFQPKVDMLSGRITGMEGLLRWHNPKLGHVSPVDFIPVAERTGLINELGRWVLREGCAQARAWADAGYGDVGIALNFSPLQFRDAELFEQILAAVESSGIKPGVLEVEVTESVVMENFTEAVGTLKRLATAGVRIAIDDFGTGYSSLAYLKHLPVDTLKIDRSFLSDTVPDDQDRLIIKAIIAMAHSMDLRVVAEGVETQIQRKLLQTLGCDELQGYLYSKPVNSSGSLELLAQYNGATSKDSVPRRTA